MISLNLDAKEVKDWIGKSTNKTARKLAMTVIAEQGRKVLQDQAEKISTTGQLHASITSRVRESEIELWALGYAEIALEEGRKPGKMPPPQALKRWARLKLGDERLAFAVARAIEKKGTRKHRTGRPKQLTMAIKELAKFVDKEAVKILKQYE